MCRAEEKIGESAHGYRAFGERNERVLELDAGEGDITL